MENELAIQVENVKKQYQLGAIGGTTFRDEMQRLVAKIKKKSDPTSRIGVQYSKEKFLALNDISFKVKKGEAVGIIGHNGAGKSTLLKLLCRVTAPTCGTISYNGRIASMLEVGTGFHPELTGRENIYMNGAILGMTKKEIDQKLEAIIEFSECRQFIDTPVKRYSSGMYVKLAFSVAAHLDADIMIMDEVLAVGDMKFQKKCLDKMKSATKEEGRTVLYVSHNMATISQLCDRCIVLKKGKIAYDGEVEEAIRVYLDNGIDTEIKKYYEDYRRPDWLVLDDARIKSVELIGKDNNYFDDDELFIIKYKLINNKLIKNLSIRIELSTQDGNAIGAAFANNVYSGKEGTEDSITLMYDISNLMPGKYKTVLTLYFLDDEKREIILDSVPGPQFEKRLINKNNIEWDSRHWGFIKLQDPKCCDENFLKRDYINN